MTTRQNDRDAMAALGNRAAWTAAQVQLLLREAIACDELGEAIEPYSGVFDVKAWLDCLVDRDVVLIRMYADGHPWKTICAQLGMSRATANRQLRYLLTVVAWKLNGRIIPTRWSRRYLLDRERELSSDEPPDPSECVRHLRVGQPGRAVRSMDEVGWIEDEDAAVARRRCEPANSEATAEDREPLL